MSLATGTRIGPYEITAQIGVGGMGEVSQATDTKLKRQVAIKVLPEALDAAGRNPEIYLVRNWFEELKRLIPTN